MTGSPPPTLTEVSEVLQLIHYAYGSLRLTKTTEADLHLTLRGHAMLWHSIVCAKTILGKKVEKKLGKTLDQLDQYFQHCFAVIIPTLIQAAQIQGIVVQEETFVITVRYHINVLAVLRQTLQYEKEILEHAN